MPLTVREEDEPMTHIDPGTYGAKRATWRTINPRSLLFQLIQDHKRADEQQWRELFWKEVQEDSDYLHAIVEYWLDHNIRSLMERSDPQLQRSQQKQKRFQQRQAMTAAAKAGLQERIETEARIVLLALEMPNGKPLGQCTGEECKAFGGWFRKIGAQVPAKTQVAAVLSENQLKKLWRSASAR
jgi:hypothetical protein